MYLLLRGLKAFEGAPVAGTREVAWDRVVLNEFDRLDDDSDCGQ